MKNEARNPHIRHANRRPVSPVEWAGITWRNDLARRARGFREHTRNPLPGRPHRVVPFSLTVGVLPQTNEDAS